MNKLTVTASPHIHSGASTRRIMLDVVIALIPALIAATFFFGTRVLLLTAATVSAAILAEMASRMVMKRDTDTIYDFSAVITGLLLALSFPVSLPVWQAALGAAIAIVVIKQMFGGLGQNFVNPAIAGRLVLMFSFPVALSAVWTPPLFGSAADAITTATSDVVTTATPLALLAEGAPLPSYWELFIGAHAGSMGETSILALLIGAAYLLWRRVISPVIPVTFIGTTLLIVTLAGEDPLVHLMTGALVIVAFFMATDYVTAPMNFKGRVVFGVGCGIITALIRLFAALPEGVSFAVILMNILTPHIETLTQPKAFGQKGGKD
ncbi:MAG: RnfABCDGE type electron transport complex subunit D [Oscillospiraceae bacterium]|nr:RnfABCDGE type electron transport complex subunit D [Oscillospiraceae bacterium]